MSFQEITIENCRHEFVEKLDYVSICKICKHKIYHYDNFGVKIVKGLFNLEPDVEFEKTDSVNYLHDKITESIALKFAEHIISLKDSELDSIDYHYYLNSNIEEMYLKFLTLSK